jgi:hypothetical protein
MPSAKVGWAKITRRNWSTVCFADSRHRKNVDEFGGVGADDLGAQQASACFFGKDLHKPLGFVGSHGFGRSLKKESLGFHFHVFHATRSGSIPHAGHLGPRVEATGDKTRIVGQGFSQKMARGHRPLNAGGMRQQRKAVHIPHRVDMGPRCLQIVVHRDASAVDDNPASSSPRSAVPGARPTHTNTCSEERVSRSKESTAIRSLFFGFRHGSIRKNRHPAFFKTFLEEPGHGGFFPGKDLRFFFDHRNVGSQLLKEAGELQARPRRRPRPPGFGEPSPSPESGRCPKWNRSTVEGRREKWTRPRGDDRRVKRDPLNAVGARHGQRMVCQKTGIAAHDLNP